jgi:hypothetical protein
VVGTRGHAVAGQDVTAGETSTLLAASNPIRLARPITALRV